MKYAQSVLDLIGNTPLIRLRKFEEGLNGVELYGKAEWFNPGGSVKDRAALNMILDGERTGQLTREKIILDATRRLGMEARAGIHTGECEFSRGDVAGIAVHIAARVGAIGRADAEFVKAKTGFSIGGTARRERSAGREQRQCHDERDPVVAEPGRRDAAQLGVEVSCGGAYAIVGKRLVDSDVECE